MKKLPIILAHILATAIPTAMNAAVIVQENFDYTAAADLNAQSGGTGFSTNWSNGTTGDHWVVDGASLDNTSNPFASVGGSARYNVPPGANNTLAFRDLTTVFQPESSGASNIWYVSFLMTIPDVTTQIGRFSLTENDGSGGSLDFENNGTSAKIDTGGTSFAETASAIASGATYFNVIKIDGSAVGSNISVGWDLYTTGTVASSDPGTGNYDVNLNTTNLNGNWDFGRMEILVGAADADIQFDQIKIGTTYNSVTAVPEPSTYAFMAGFLALGLVIYRRRRN